MNAMEKHVALLGFRAEDAVTGFKGVVTSISFDLYGCVQAVISPGVDEKGEVKTGLWFDVARLRIMSKEPVMPAPDFGTPPAVLAAQGRKGPAEKPVP